MPGPSRPGCGVAACAPPAPLRAPPAGATAAWALPASYAAVAVIGLAWGLVLKVFRPDVYAAIGLGPHAVTGQLAPASEGARP